MADRPNHRVHGMYRDVLVTSSTVGDPDAITIHHLFSTQRIARHLGDRPRSNQFHSDEATRLTNRLREEAIERLVDQGLEIAKHLGLRCQIGLQRFDTTFLDEKRSMLVHATAELVAIPTLDDEEEVMAPLGGIFGWAVPSSVYEDNLQIRPIDAALDHGTLLHLFKSPHIMALGSYDPEDLALRYCDSDDPGRCHYLISHNGSPIGAGRSLEVSPQALPLDLDVVAPVLELCFSIDGSNLGQDLGARALRALTEVVAPTAGSVLVRVPINDKRLLDIIHRAGFDAHAVDQQNKLVGVLRRKNGQLARVTDPDGPDPS